MVIIYCHNNSYRTFYLIIDALKYELFNLLGYEIHHTTVLTGLKESDIIICFGFHRMIKARPNISALCLVHKIIVYNMEQLPTGKWDHMIKEMHNVCEVWDYSMNNIKYLAEKNIQNTRYVPFAYSKAYEIIKNPYDDQRYNAHLTFAGSDNSRRNNILTKLAKNYLMDIHSYSRNNLVYFDDYTKLLESRGIHINIHYYVPSILEIVRIIPLVCNRCCVISEHSDDHELDQTFSDYIQWINFDSDYNDQLDDIIKNSKNLAEECYNKFKNNLKYSDVLINSGCLDKLQKPLICEEPQIDKKLQALYGRDSIQLDVAHVIYKCFVQNETINIRANQKLNNYFGDPIKNVAKELKLTINDKVYMIPENRAEDIVILLSN